MRFFLDACIAKKIAEGLAAFATGTEDEVVHLTDRFPADTPDVDWIRALQAEGDWILVSADPRISRNRIEQAAWQESRLTAFFFVDFARRRFWEQAREIVGRWPDIVMKARESPRGSGFLIKPRQSRIELIYEPLPPTTHDG